MTLINEILRALTSKDDIILDSFAGSGSKAHATLNLNNEDGGNRKFILIEMEEYANDIIAERVKRKDLELKIKKQKVLVDLSISMN